MTFRREENGDFKKEGAVRTSTQKGPIRGALRVKGLEFNESRGYLVCYLVSNHLFFTVVGIFMLLLEVQIDWKIHCS